MYKLTNNQTGLEIGVTENLHFVRKNPSSGSFIQCTEAEAEGVAFNGLWNIFPNSKISDSEASGIAVISQIDITEYIKQMNKTKADLDYVAMMCDVDILTEPENNIEEEI